MSDPTPDELKRKFWKHLGKDMFVMLSLPGEVAARPMTAQLVDGEEHGPIWFFTSRETDLVRALPHAGKAEMTFIAKGDDLFATVRGAIAADNNRAQIDALWSKPVSAWFEGGKDDPNLQLLRFDPDEAQIWLGGSLLTGLKMLIGSDDVKEDAKGREAKVNLR